ncbi:ATP-binding protein [Fulvivirga sp.]|uniref:ATP-binding protein n=1 Tax=Fulvivirga sp. TaxID=1931237 RepID=UPI0032EC978A
MRQLFVIVSVALSNLFRRFLFGRFFACLFIFLVIQSTLAWGQNRKIDSLRNLQETPLPDSTYLEVLLALAKEHEEKGVINDLYKEAIAKASSAKDQKGIRKVIEVYTQWLRENSNQPDAIVSTFELGLSLVSDAKHRLSLYYHLGEFYYGQGEDKAAQNSIHAGIKIAEENDLPQHVARGYVILGNGQFYKLEYEKAFLFYTKADSVCEVNENLKVSPLRAKILNYIGYSVRVTHGYEKAVEYYFKAKEMYEELNDLSGIQEVNLGLTQYYTSVGDYNKAEKLLSEAINYYKDKGPQSSYTYAIISRGYFFLKQEKYNEALQDYQLYYDIAFEGTNKLFQLNALNYMSYLYLEIGDLALASKFGEDGIKLSKEIGEVETRKVMYEQLVLIYTQDEATEKLNQTYKDYITLRDELDSIGKDEEIFELEAKYQTEKKEQEIALLTTQNQLAQQEKQNQLYLLSGIVLIVLIAAIFFFILYRNRQKTTNKLQELDIIKSNFFANISHEFRTPLTLIKGPVQEQLAHGGLSDSNRAHLQMINRNADRLLSLVDQLLDLSKLESGSLKLNIERASLSSFSRVVVAPFRYLAERKGIEFITNVTEMGDCHFDKDILEKIVVNLLSNAIKYTPEGGKVQYEQKVSGHLAIIEVRNTGAGIPKDQQRKIFDRFYQMGKNQGGVGIGLALVKELVTLHKGSISLTSNENEFTCFEVQLPIADTNYATDERASDSQIRETSFPKEEADYIITAPDIIDSEKPIMLIVEDNSDLRELIRGLFNTYYSILQAENGEEGIQKAIEHVPDVIISDVMMPIKDGVELSQTLKADERTSHIPIILLTAKAGDENELKGLETGADEYMVKPFNNEILKVRVEKLIELRTQLRERYSQEVILQPKDIAISSVDEKFLDRVQSIIDSHLTKSDFTAELFSKEIGMSRMQLHRKLKALIGLSTSEFIRSQRLKMAAQLLDTSDVNMSEVAYAVGFNDPSYFAKCFKDAYGCTPSQYAAEVHTNG